MTLKILKNLKHKTILRVNENNGNILETPEFKFLRKNEQTNLMLSDVQCLGESLQNTF